MTEEALNAEVLNNRLDRWLQRAAVVVMVAVAVTLMALGFAMYGRSGNAIVFQADKVTTVQTVTTVAGK